MFLIGIKDIVNCSYFICYLALKWVRPWNKCSCSGYVAQDLLDSWIQRKKVDDLLVECDLREEKWSHTEQKCTQPGVANSLEQFSLGPDGSIHYDPLDNYYEDINIETRKPGEQRVLQYF